VPGVAVVLALSASTLWGTADFVGGLAARRFGVLTIAVLSQSAGLLPLLVLAMREGGPSSGLGVLLGVAAGMFGAVSFSSFLKALQLGTMSVVSPIVSSGPVFAFLLAIATGERPSLPALIGAAVVASGILLSSVEEYRGGHHRKTALVWALVASVAVGLQLYFLGRASNEIGSVMALLWARVTSLALLVIVALAARPRLRVGPLWSGITVALGIAANGGLFLFGRAAEIGLISVSAILSSLYPVVTVLLAHGLLGERLRQVQRVGVLLIVTGVALTLAG
jgi:drug/metabolite transporter (DMT)-like permease